MGGVGALGGEDFNAAGWTLNVLVAGRIAVRVDLKKRAVPVDFGYLL